MAVSFRLRLRFHGFAESMVDVWYCCEVFFLLLRSLLTVGVFVPRSIDA